MERRSQGQWVRVRDYRRQSRQSYAAFAGSAKYVFADLTFTFEDDRYNYGEQRFITLGLLQGRFVAIVHTEINGEIRIISFRKGTKHEQCIFSDNI